MFSNRLVFAAVALACVLAAGAGGYIASRQNAVPAPVAATSAPAPAATVAPAARPVQETEAVVGDTSAIPSRDREQVTVVTKSAGKRDAKAPGKASARQSPATTDSGRRTAKSSEGAATAGAPGTLTSSWPSGSASQPGSSQTAEQSGATTHPSDATAESARAQEPPQKTFEDLVVSADSVIGLQTEGRITSETAHIEDRVEARVSRDVKVGDRVAIPAGARALGTVTLVERGGKFKERARLGVRFHTLVLADGTRLPVSTETIYRDGEAPSTGTAQKMGGAAVGGAILGAILGGAKGAAIGAAAGAGGGAAVVAAGDRSEAVLQPGTPMTVRILSPVTVTIEK